MRRAPKNARKIIELPSGIRLDRAIRILSAVNATDEYDPYCTVVPLADGSLAVYKHQWSQS